MIRYIQLVAYNIQFWNQWLFHLFLNGSDFHSLSSIGMTVEANRLLAIYKASYAVPSTSTGIGRNIENLQPSAKVKLDKNLGWIPNPRTEMNKFYDNVYKPFYSERSGVYRQKRTSRMHSTLMPNVNMTMRRTFQKSGSKWSIFSPKKILHRLGISSGKTMC